MREFLGLGVLDGSGGALSFGLPVLGAPAIQQAL
jgi:hypothetical protein